MQHAEETPYGDVFHVAYEQTTLISSDESIKSQQTSSTQIQSIAQGEKGETEEETILVSPDTPEAPLTHGTVVEPTSSWEALVRMRSLHELYDVTEPMKLDYSDLCLLGTEEPTIFQDADREESWRCAMQEEIDSIRNNQTWSLVEPSVGQRVIGLKWIYKVKKDSDGKVVKHKARLVAKGYV
jgi:Reverse transcriptase (RNA-dependent DNA polymerase)